MSLAAQGLAGEHRKIRAPQEQSCIQLLSFTEPRMQVTLLHAQWQDRNIGESLCLSFPIP